MASCLHSAQCWSFSCSVFSQSYSVGDSAMTRSEARAHILAGCVISVVIPCETHILTASVELLPHRRSAMLTLRSSAYFPRAIGVTLPQSGGLHPATLQPGVVHSPPPESGYPLFVKVKTGIDFSKKIPHFCPRARTCVRKGLTMKQFYVLWTYIGNYSKLMPVKADSPQKALKLTTEGFGPEFLRNAIVFVFDHSPALISYKSEELTRVGPNGTSHVTLYSHKGKTIKGFLTTDDNGEYVFHAYT